MMIIPLFQIFTYPTAERTSSFRHTFFLSTNTIFCLIFLHARARKLQQNRLKCNETDSQQNSINCDKTDLSPHFSCGEISPHYNLPWQIFSPQAPPVPVPLSNTHFNSENPEKYIMTENTRGPRKCDLDNLD